MKFNKYNIHPQIKENLEQLGFRKPTDIQYKAIPHILKKEDILAIAQTGTGKTAAFAIPIIQLLLSGRNYCDKYETRCIVMVPTHELAIQVAEVFGKIMKGLDLNVLGLFGGVDQQPQIDNLKKGVDVVVATPGRMFDMASQDYLSFNKVEILVLDEADHMLELGFIHDMKQLISRIPRNRQTLFFSATINTRIKDLAYGLVNHAVRIQISPKDPVSRNIDHAVAFIEMDDKRFFLENFITNNPDSKILVFVRTKVRAERLVKAMERVEINTKAIHGDKDQKQRSNVLNEFKSGENKILIATDVSARGIDIPNVDYVINYDLPEISENYVHRVGRTGRGMNRGTAISFCSESEKSILEEIETFLNSRIAVIDIDKYDYKNTIDFSQEKSQNWQELLEEQEKLEAQIKTIKRKKKKK